MTTVSIGEPTLRPRAYLRSGVADESAHNIATWTFGMIIFLRRSAASFGTCGTRFSHRSSPRCRVLRADWIRATALRGRVLQNLTPLSAALRKLYKAFNTTSVRGRTG